MQLALQLAHPQRETNWTKMLNDVEHILNGATPARRLPGPRRSFKTTKPLSFFEKKSWMHLGVAKIKRASYLCRLQIDVNWVRPVWGTLGRPAHDLSCEKRRRMTQNPSKLTAMRSCRFLDSVDEIGILDLDINYPRPVLSEAGDIFLLHMQRRINQYKPLTCIRRIKNYGQGSSPSREHTQPVVCCYPERPFEKPNWKGRTLKPT